MARDQFLITPDRPFIHRPVTGSGLLKAGAVVDALDVLDQVVTLAGAFRRARLYVKATVAGVLKFEVVRPGGTVNGVYDTNLIADVNLVADTEAVIDFADTDYFGEAAILVTLTGDAGIVSPGTVTYIDICGV